MADDQDNQDNVANDDVNNMLNLSRQEVRCAGEIDQLMGSADAGEVSSAYGDYCGTMDKMREMVRLGEGGSVTRARFEEWNQYLGNSGDQRRNVVAALKRHYAALLETERASVTDLREQLKDKADRADKVRQALADANTATDLVSKLLIIKEAVEAVEGVLEAAAEEHSDPTTWGADVGSGKAAAESIEGSLEGLAGYSVELEAVLQGWSGLSDMESDIRTTVRAMHDQFTTMQADTAWLDRVTALPDD